ncbi:solute carrier family 13 member 2-like isoform X1 [Pomacea canaliculata]|uniref:solute carrier family 13 member 2-like isoform X1 n=2 Tax=Pomacea canaliculata TaxID=400727 RepID=UPI000D72DA95|nr:solute carrier family 13 member 2-like isoform X1 [Pomacea canaliculata]
MSSVWQHVKASRTVLLILIVPLALLPLPLVVNESEAKCAYVVIVMAVYWISECVPMSATALLPLVLFPLLGVLPGSITAKEYMSDTLMMSLGGLIVATAIETWNLHKRIALRIMMFVGPEPRWLMLGMMLATWFLSMWISNTATTAMMIPITEAILQQLKTTTKKSEEAMKGTNEIGMNEVAAPDQEYSQIVEPDQQVQIVGPELNSHEAAPDLRNEIVVPGVNPDEKIKSETDSSPPIQEVGAQGDNRDITEQQEDATFRRLCKGMSLSVCYAANTGGIATLTGTGPNLVCKGFSDQLFAEYGIKSPINFATWMGFGLPLSACMLVVCWLWLQLAFLGYRKFARCSRQQAGTHDEDQSKRVKAIVRSEYENLGPISFAEGSLMFWFVTLVLLWLTRDVGGVGGWGDAFPSGMASDSTASISIAFILFFYPSTPPAILVRRHRSEKHQSASDINKGPEKLVPLLNWEVIHKKIPWGLLLLLGGGYAMARGCQESGLSQWIGEKLEVFKEVNHWGMLFIICYIAAATTEVTSNSAISTLLMPILSRLALNTGVNPLAYLISGTISCSLAFMLPVATPPNAIVFSYGRVRIIDMILAGLGMNLLAVPLVVLAAGTLGDAIFEFKTFHEAFRNRSMSTI